MKTKDSKLIFHPLLLGLALALLPATAPAQEAHKVDGYHEFNSGRVREGEENWTESIQVSEPAPRSEIKGDVSVRFKAPGMNWATSWCWQQPDNPGQVPPQAWGRDVELTPGGFKLEADGSGSFVFPADKFPNGPVNVRIHAKNDAGKKDVYELQLFNLGGVPWNQGIPKTDPPAARGLQLIFADDFTEKLSISNDGRGARYGAHKPGGGDFSGWVFSDVLGDGKPFGQQGNWLRIAARKDAQSPKGRSGIIATVDQDFKGVWAKAPFYAECRFTAQSAPGTWPAFWTLSFGGQGVTDELDIIEAYGGRGKGNPNNPGYSLVSHFWGQKNPDGSQRKAYSAHPLIMDLAGKSYWSTTFHTYAVYVGLEETVFYFDDVEVLRHPTNNIGRENPHCFLINLAIGGLSGWPINLSRYAEGTDMWVDYIRVYAKEPVPGDYRPNFDPLPDLKGSAIGLNFSLDEKLSTLLEPRGSAGMTGARQKNWNNIKGGQGETSTLNDSDGKSLSGLSAKWSASGSDGKIVEGKAWGFNHSNGKLQLGLAFDAGSLEVRGVPYRNYDVIVYLGADEHGGGGSVSIKALQGQVDPNPTYFYKVGWMKGEFVPSTFTTAAEVKESNCVIFKGNSAPSFQIDWIGNQGAKTGVSAVQIVERP